MTDAKLKVPHAIIDYDHERGMLVGSYRTRSRCACSWQSDSYTARVDAQRAGEVHVRQATREDFDGLIAKSSIGVAIADVKARGIDAHLVGLESTLRRPKRKRA